MNLKIAVAFLLLGLTLVPTLAQNTTATQEAETPIHTITWDQYSFSYPDWLFTDVEFSWRPALLIGNGPLIRPDVVEVNLGLVHLEDSMFPGGSIGEIEFYNAADLTDDSVYSAAAVDLQKLLDERPDLNAYEGVVPLLDPKAGLPYVSRGAPRQTLITRADYLETDLVDGIAYLVVQSEFDGALKPTDPKYIFQGISHDGKTYISVELYITATAIAEAVNDEEMYLAEESAALTPYLADGLVTLDSATPDQFEPNLDDVKALVQSIAIK